MFITIGNHRFAVTLAPSEAARTFAASLPITLNMAELNGNEKHGDLQRVLPTNERHPGTIQAGDVLLWGSRTVVIFYKTFHSSYSYTTLGRIADPAGLADALGSDDVRVVFSED